MGSASKQRRFPRPYQQSVPPLGPSLQGPTAGSRRRKAKGRQPGLLQPLPRQRRFGRLRELRMQQVVGRTHLHSSQGMQQRRQPRDSLGHRRRWGADHSMLQPLQPLGHTAQHLPLMRSQKRGMPPLLWQQGQLPR